MSQRQTVDLRLDSVPQLSTAPASEPITRAEAKNHLRVDFTDDDTLIDVLIEAARVHAENYTARRLINQTWTLTFPEFSDVMLLPGSPLSSITSVSYLDSNQASQTLSSAIYEADTTRDPGALRRKRDQSFPTTYPVWNAVVVTYVTGYGASASDVPAAIRQAMLMHIGHMYENRESSIDKTISMVPMGWESLLAPYRIWL